MPRGDTCACTDKQKRKAKHIEQDYREKGVPTEEAEKRARVTVNKDDGDGNKSSAGRTNHSRKF